MVPCQVSVVPFHVPTAAIFPVLATATNILAPYAILTHSLSVESPNVGSVDAVQVVLFVE